MANFTANIFVDDVEEVVNIQTAVLRMKDRVQEYDGNLLWRTAIKQSILISSNTKISETKFSGAKWNCYLNSKWFSLHEFQVLFFLFLLLVLTLFNW